MAIAKTYRYAPSKLKPGELAVTPDGLHFGQPKQADRKFSWHGEPFSVTLGDDSTISITVNTAEA